METRYDKYAPKQRPAYLSILRDVAGITETGELEPPIIGAKPNCRAKVWTGKNHICKVLCFDDQSHPVAERLVVAGLLTKHAASELGFARFVVYSRETSECLTPGGTEPLHCVGYKLTELGAVCVMAHLNLEDAPLCTAAAFARRSKARRQWYKAAREVEKIMLGGERQ